MNEHLNDVYLALRDVLCFVTFSEHFDGTDHGTGCLNTCTPTCMHHDTWHDVTRDLYTSAQIDNSNHLMNKITTDLEPVHLRDVGGSFRGHSDAFPDVSFSKQQSLRVTPPHGLTFLDVSLTHPRAATYAINAAAMQGCAAAKRDALKCLGNNSHHHPGHTFIPASVETLGHLGKPLVRYLKTLSEVAARRGPAVTKGSFLAGAYRELSVALIQCQGSVYRGCANLMARAAGWQASPGAEVPYED